MGMGKELKQYFQKIGRKGGKVRSERKTNACRENAKKPRRKKKEDRQASRQVEQ
jgi:hypothetical protein